MTNSPLPPHTFPVLPFPTSAALWRSSHPEVYGHPERGLRIVGITGTKGKSTTAYMLRSIFEAAGMETSILGSIETDDGVEHYESHNTTPEAPELWRHLWHTARSLVDPSW